MTVEREPPSSPLLPHSQKTPTHPINALPSQTGQPINQITRPAHRPWNALDTMSSTSAACVPHDAQTYSRGPPRYCLKGRPILACWCWTASSSSSSWFSRSEAAAERQPRAAAAARLEKGQTRAAVLAGRRAPVEVPRTKARAWGPAALLKRRGPARRRRRAQTGAVGGDERVRRRGGARRRGARCARERAGGGGGDGEAAQTRRGDLLVLVDWIELGVFSVCTPQRCLADVWRAARRGLPHRAPAGLLACGRAPSRTRVYIQAAAVPGVQGSRSPSRRALCDPWTAVGRASRALDGCRARYRPLHRPSRPIPPECPHAPPSPWPGRALSESQCDFRRVGAGGEAVYRAVSGAGGDLNVL